MIVTISKWGNSQGIRIPKGLLDALGMKENDAVELIQKDKHLEIKKISPSQHKTLEERLEAFYGKPISKIELPEEQELDWGHSSGSEVW